MPFDFDKLKDLMSDYVSDQPYSVVCYNCGEGLKFIKGVDSQMDISIVVYPCKCKGE